MKEAQEQFKLIKREQFLLKQKKKLQKKRGH